MGVELNFLRAGRVVNLISDIVTSDLTFLFTCMCAQDRLRHTHFKMLNGLKMEKKFAMDIFCTSVVTTRFKRNQYFSKNKNLKK